MNQLIIMVLTAIYFSKDLAKAQSVYEYRQGTSW